MSFASLKKKYGPEVQKLDPNAPIEDIIYLIKRDGGVFIKGLISEKDIDKAAEDSFQRFEDDPEWEGTFFPKETKRAPNMLTLSSTCTYTQVMNPLYQAVVDHFLTTRTRYWWGDEIKESLSKPQLHSCTGMRIGPGGKAQPLHRDDYIAHKIHRRIDLWDDERDKDRESAVGMFVAGSKVTKENGGTVFIPGSHKWATDLTTPPDKSLCNYAEMSKGDAFIMLASVFHGGGSNITKNEYRIVWCTFSTRGYYRQEENQFLAVPRNVTLNYSREVQDFMGYTMSDPSCGHVEQMDPMYHLYPAMEKKYRDFS